MEIGNDIKWSSVLEGFFKDMGEKAFCYGYLHKKCEAKYSNKRNFIDLPVIVLSTVAGTLSIGNSSIFGQENEQIANMGIGVLSLFVSVLNTIGTYFSFAKRAEAHRQSSIQYEKLYRFLDIELSLPRKERMRPTDLLKTCRDNYERLSEVSPLIPYDILKSFKKRFRKYDVSKPSEANGLEKIDIYKKKSKSKYTCHSDNDSDSESSSSSRIESSELEDVIIDSSPTFLKKPYSNNLIAPVPNINNSVNSLSNISEEEAEKLLALLRQPSNIIPSISSNLGYNQTQNIRSDPYLINEMSKTLETPVDISKSLSSISKNIVDNAMGNVLENFGENLDRAKSLVGENLINSINKTEKSIINMKENGAEAIEKTLDNTTEVINNIVEKNDSNNK